MRDDFEERYLSGAELYGEDFGPDELAEWYADEVGAYASLGAAAHADATTYGYHALNRRHGFRRLPPDRRFEHALGLGSAYGGELLPIADRLDAVTILEPSPALTTSVIGRLAPTYRSPLPSGDMPFDDGAFDLVLSLGTLHHIPNVARVLAEVGRVTSADGFLLLREPIISMGDWRFQRKPGVTARERGIPQRLLLEHIRDAGFDVESAHPVIFPITARMGRLIGSPAFNVRSLTLLDAALCRLSSFNYRYHATNIVQKLRPTSLFVVARRRS